MANNFIWGNYAGQPPRALLPYYQFPDWMNAANYNLLQYGYQVPVRFNLPLQQSGIQRQRIAAHQRGNVRQTADHRPKETVRAAAGTSNSTKNYPEKRKFSSDEDENGKSSTVKRNKKSQESSDDESDDDDDDDDDDLDDLDLLTQQRKRLSEEIWEYTDLHVQKEPDYRTKEELRIRLEQGIREIYRRSDLVLVGSSLNGFGCRGSDADFCLLVSLQAVDQRRDARYMLDEIHRYMRSNFSYIWKSCVIYAKVPIMRFTDRITGIECDININNITGIRNTHLIQAYSKVDRRVVPLVLWIKHWAKSNGINDASQGTLSSYSIVLLVLHYLQDICDPPIIPSLQENYQDIFSPHRDIFRIQASLNGRILEPSIQFKSRNMESLGELLMGFFKHVASFNFRKNIISVRRGAYFNLISGWRPQLIHIEEPFEKQNVARAVHQSYRYVEILDKFKAAHKTLTEDPRCYLDDLLSLGKSNEPKKKKTKRQRIKEALKYISRKEKGIKKLIPFRSSQNGGKVTREEAAEENGQNIEGSTHRKKGTKR